ncbi:MAG: winged helix-turn-helix domain-containing protein [Acidobacteriota bacterium]|nr:winged helix-turn-helix domain-containing protein [Acidobacteriota bacterium]
MIHKVWRDNFVEESNIAVQVSKLRKLLSASKSEPFIETASGVGYRFVSRVRTIGQKDWNKENHNEKTSELKEFANPHLPSIAVLPFQNIGGNEEIEYLAEGLTESLINKLSYVPGLKVLGRNTVYRFKDSAQDAREIGALMAVETVLTGRVKLVKDNIVVSVELAKAARRADVGRKI